MIEHDALDARARLDSMIASQERCETAAGQAAKRLAEREQSLESMQLELEQLGRELSSGREEVVRQDTLQAAARRELAQLEEALAVARRRRDALQNEVHQVDTALRCAYPQTLLRSAH